MIFHNYAYEKFADGTEKCIQDEIPFELPEGWEWARLQTICEPITDGTHKTPTYSDCGYIFLSSKNVTAGHIDWDTILRSKGQSAGKEKSHCYQATAQSRL